MSATDSPAPQAAPPPGSVEGRTLQALLSIVDDLTVERDEAGLLGTALDHLVTSLDVTGGAIFLTGAGDVSLAAARGLGDDEAAALREAAIPAAERRHPTVGAHGAGLGWIAMAPLLTKQKALGVLILFHRYSGEAPPVPLLEAVGKQIGVSLDNVRLYAQVRASSARWEVLNRLTASLASGREVVAVLPDFAAELKRVQTFDRLACGFVNDAGDYIEVAGHPEGATWGFGAVMPVVGSGLGSVLLNERSILQTDLLHSHRYIEDMRLLEEGIRSYVVLPLVSRGRGLGVLALGAREGGAFDEDALGRLQPLVDAVALALENVRLFQKTRELSLTDEVTPLFNFRFFHQILDRELKLVDRYRSVLSLLFIDLDRFKPINDQYGHLRGSRVLREVGFLLRSAVRETDYPARYGGDEFVVILPQTDRQAAESLGEKLRHLIEDHVFLQEEGIDARLGVSLGAAAYPAEATSKEALIRLADERMYGDKDRRKTGR
jgi:diguanylate cyclase (GGDEF)-like protein